MNIPTITMPKEEAEAKLKAYRGQLQKRTNEEYFQALRGYQALAEGTPIISASMALAAAGFDLFHRPRLAIARADRQQVCFDWDGTWGTGGTMQFSTLRRSRWSYEGDLFLRFPTDEAPEGRKNTSWYSLVPMVPADVMPKGQLRDFFVLWEVEEWFSRPRIAQPDRDPYLLQRLGGDMFAVVAEWELTELERLVMLGRQQG